MAHLGVSSHLKMCKKHDLVPTPIKATYHNSHARILANKLIQDGVLSTVENVLHTVDEVVDNLVANNSTKLLSSSIRDNVVDLCQHLKVYGAYLDILYKEQLDHAFKVFRDKAQDDGHVDLVARVHLLELIELRANGWKGTESMNVYYRKKVAKIDALEGSNNNNNNSYNGPNNSSADGTASMMVLSAGEVLKSSGKYNKPTKITGKKYCKDEIVIRNGDSGKVNPGAKERLVQITGANEDSINYAKQLMEDTIRQNASPIRDVDSPIDSGSSHHIFDLDSPVTKEMQRSNSGGGGGGLTTSSSSINSTSTDDSALPSSMRTSRCPMTDDSNLTDYKYSVIVGDSVIRITSDNLDLVRTSKLVLEEYFKHNNQPQQNYEFNANHFATSSPFLSPPESLPSPHNTTLNGPIMDEIDGKLSTVRRPKMALRAHLLNSEPSPKRVIYSNEYLNKLAMSPLCIGPLPELERISKEFPFLMRQVM